MIPLTSIGRALSLGCLVFATLAGCSSEPKFAETPQPDAGLPPPPPPPPTNTTPPPPAVATPCDATQSLALSTMLQARAASEAPGMKPEGGPICGVIPEGQGYAPSSIMMEPGYCYTVLGNSLPPVGDLELAIELDPAVIPPVLAPLLQGQSPKLAVDGNNAGPQEAVGAKGNCYQWPWPAPMNVKIAIKSKQGTGPIAAQVYKKRK